MRILGSCTLACIKELLPNLAASGLWGAFPALAGVAATAGGVQVAAVPLAAGLICVAAFVGLKRVCHRKSDEEEQRDLAAALDVIRRRGAKAEAELADLGFQSKMNFENLHLRLTALDRSVGGLRDHLSRGFDDLDATLEAHFAVNRDQFDDLTFFLWTNFEELKSLQQPLQSLPGSVDALKNDIATTCQKLEARLTLMDERIRDVQALVKEMHSGSLTAATIRTAGNLAAAKIAPNQFFTGREEELARLHSALAGGSVAIVHALTGEGGIGKTELAKVYALIFAPSYDSVWWIDASASSLRGELVKVYEKVGGSKPPDTTEVGDLCQALVEHWSGKRPLILLDNVEAPEHFTLFSALPTARVLATTRQHHKTMPGVTAFSLGVLPAHDAVALMRKEIAPHRTDVSDADLTAIAEELDGHALAVALAGAYLANYPHYSAREVLEKLKASKVGDVDPVDDEATHDPLGLTYRKSVAASLSLSFTLEEVKPALPLLFAAAFLHPTGITLEWLMAGTGWDKSRASKAAGTLAKYSIIKTHSATAGAPASVSVHRLTQGVARARAEVVWGEESAAIFSRLLGAMIELFRWPGTIAEQQIDHIRTPARLAALAHAEAVLSHADLLVRGAGDWLTAPLPRPAPRLPDAGARLRAEMAHRLAAAGQLADAARHIDGAIQWGEAQNPRDERSLAIWYASRASIRQNRGDLNGAEEDIERSIQWEEAQNPRDERELAIRYASRASIRQDRGDLKGAEEDIARSIQWGEAQNPRDERSLAIDYASRARIRQNRGDLKGAEEDIARSIQWAEAQNPRDERSLAILYAARSSIRQALSDLKGAEEDIERSIRWGEAQDPRDEGELAFRYETKALILARAGRFDEARVAIDESVRLYTAVFGAEHAWTKITIERQRAIHAGEAPP